MSTALLVGLDGDTPSALTEASGLPGVEMEAVSEADRALDRLREAGEGVDTVVIGPLVENPLGLAQRLYRLDRDLGVLILAPEERLEALRSGLTFTPFVGQQTRYHPARSRDGFRGELLRSISETRTRRAHRAQLRALSLKLSEAPPRPRAAAVLDRLLEFAPVGFLTLDAGGTVEAANQAAQQMFSDLPSLIGSRFSEHFSPEARVALDGLLKEAVVDGLPGRAELARTAGPGPGPGQILEATLTALETGGERQELLVILQDVSDRVRGERERGELLGKLEAAVRLRDEFLSVASHELRTPLTAMLGWLAMLRSGKLAPEKHARALETIERNARAQAQLIEDLLDVSRIVSGKVKLELAAVSLEELIRLATESISPAAEAKGIRLQVMTDTQLGPVLGDPHRLQQVVWNLLSNAVKFTPRGGRVQVVLRQSGSSAELVVSDTGAGIDPSFLPFLFERFRQADASTTRSHGGLGLGLSIVRHFVELHGGRVQASSAGLGLGSSFTVCLPLSALSAPEQLPLTPSTVQELDCPPRLAGVRVLLVEDEPDVRELLVSVLNSCRLVVTAVASAEEGLAELRRQPPDVLISDIGMAGEDGYTFLGKVRALAPEEGGRVPALAITAYAKPEERRRALRAGFQMHLAKPISPEELLLVLANLTGRL